MEDECKDLFCRDGWVGASYTRVHQLYDDDLVEIHLIKDDRKEGRAWERVASFDTSINNYGRGTVIAYFDDEEYRYVIGRIICFHPSERYHMLWTDIGVVMLTLRAMDEVIIIRHEPLYGGIPPELSQDPPSGSIELGAEFEQRLLSFITLTMTPNTISRILRLGQNKRSAEIQKIVEFVQTTRKGLIGIDNQRPGQEYTFPGLFDVLPSGERIRDLLTSCCRGQLRDAVLADCVDRLKECEIVNLPDLGLHREVKFMDPFDNIDRIADLLPYLRTLHHTQFICSFPLDQLSEETRAALQKEGLTKPEHIISMSSILRDLDPKSMRAVCEEVFGLHVEETSLEEADEEDEEEKEEDEEDEDAWLPAIVTDGLSGKFRPGHFRVVVQLTETFTVAPGDMRSDTRSLKEGDPVTVMRGGKWVPAVFMRKKKNGAWRVRTMDNDTTLISNEKAIRLDDPQHMKNRKVAFTRKGKLCIDTCRDVNQDEATLSGGFCIGLCGLDCIEYTEHDAVRVLFDGHGRREKINREIQDSHLQVREEKEMEAYERNVKEFTVLDEQTEREARSRVVTELKKFPPKVIEMVRRRMPSRPRKCALNSSTQRVYNIDPMSSHDFIDLSKLCPDYWNFCPTSATVQDLCQIYNDELMDLDARVKHRKDPIAGQACEEEEDDFEDEDTDSDEEPRPRRLLGKRPRELPAPNYDPWA